MKHIYIKVLMPILMLLLVACGSNATTETDAATDVAPADAPPTVVSESTDTEAASTERDDPDNPVRLDITGALTLNDASAYLTNIDTYPTSRSEPVFYIGYADRANDHFVDIRGLPVSLEVGTYAIEPNDNGLAPVASASLKIGIMPDDPTYLATEGEFIVDTLADGVFSGSYRFVGEYEGDVVTVAGTMSDVPLPE